MSITTEPEAAPILPDPGAPDPFNPPETAEAPPTPELDDVEKQTATKVWTVEGELSGIVRGQPVSEQWSRSYEQKPLSYLGMIQFTGLLGRKIDEAMSGPDGLSLQVLDDLGPIAAAVASGDRSVAMANLDLSGIDQFIQGFAKIAGYAPDLIGESQCIWLRIPFSERMIVQEIWSRPVEEGGLSGDDGEEMMILFINQNYEELERFFVQRVRRIATTIQKARKRLHPEATPAAG